MDKDFLRKIAEIGEKENLDRSSTIRKLVYMGYKEKIKEEAINEYLSGKITLSETAHKAGISIWDVLKILVEKGYKSSYSIEDLEEELNLLD